MKVQILATVAGLAVFAGFLPYVPASVLHGRWDDPQRYSAADLASSSMQTGIEKGVRFFASGARADEVATPTIDVSKLVKIGNSSYDISYDDSVSLNPINSSVVNKIGYGKSREVRIVTTSSGTYSTDGFASNHVLYTGVQVSRVAENDSPTGAFAWVSGQGWIGLNTVGKGSFSYFGDMNGGGFYVTGNNGTCYSGMGYSSCN